MNELGNQPVKAPEAKPDFSGIYLKAVAGFLRDINHDC